MSNQSHASHNVVCFTGTEYNLKFVRGTVTDFKIDLKDALQTLGEHDLPKCSHLAVTQHL